MMSVPNSSTNHDLQEEIYKSSIEIRGIKPSSGAHMLLRMFNGRHSTSVVPTRTKQYCPATRLFSRTVFSSVMNPSRLAHFPWLSLIQQSIHCMKFSLSDVDQNIFCRMVSLQPDEFSPSGTDGQIGGTLGFYCRWYYGHANDQHHESQQLPQSFKGIDLVFYNSVCQMAKLFGLTISIRVIMWPEIHSATKSTNQETSVLEPTFRDQDVVPLYRFMNFVELLWL